MYPNDFFALFPPFPRTNRAFIAMSFDSAFDRRWEQVIKPGIEGVLRNGEPLKPFRVDLSRKSDAILSEILRAVADSAVVIADISAKHELDGRPVRNANVMYEVGLAHAVRLPDEVVLFRSDKLALDFDIAGVRVHSYAPDADSESARKQVTQTVVDALSGLESRKRDSVRAASQRLTLPAANLLFEVVMQGTVSHPATRTLGQVLGAVQRTEAIRVLLDLGAIRADATRITADMIDKMGAPGSVEPDLLTYVPTSFGHALLTEFGEGLGVLDESVRPALERLLAKAGPNSAA